MVSTPHSVQQENLYGIGWYKILHRTRSRQGQSLESQAISVIHPGDLVYIEATALWKNRIRGKLGKNAAGWLTMEDVIEKRSLLKKQSHLLNTKRVHAKKKKLKNPFK